MRGQERCCTSKETASSSKESYVRVITTAPALAACIRTGERSGSRGWSKRVEGDRPSAALHRGMSAAGTQSFRLGPHDQILRRLSGRPPSAPRRRWTTARTTRYRKALLRLRVPVGALESLDIHHHARLVAVTGGERNAVRPRRLVREPAGRDLVRWSHAEMGSETPRLRARWAQRRLRLPTPSARASTTINADVLHRGSRTLISDSSS